jgi:glycosyltransferase involved in cell wall biosynthesis
MSPPSTESRSSSATAIVEPPAPLPALAALPGAAATPQAPPSRPGAARVLVVIPAHNEEMNIGRLIDEIRGLKYTYDVVVVDDASLDGTAGELERRGQRSIRLCTNLGYGAAVQTGFKYALEHGYDFVVQMDGDGQHDPASVPALLAPVLAGEADVALGSRFTGKISYQVPFLRKCGIALFRGLVSFFIQQPITDPTSGFQAHNRKVLSFFTGDRYPMDYPDSDVLLALHFAGFRIREVPVAMRPRLHGQSMHGGWKTIYYLAKMLLAMSMVLLRHYRSRKPGE